MTDKDMIRRGDVTEILLDEGWYGQTMSRVEGLPRAVLADLPEVQAMLREVRNNALRQTVELLEDRAGHLLDDMEGMWTGSAAFKRMEQRRHECLQRRDEILALIQEAPHDPAHIAIEERGE